eukprot:m.26981 g.26981  ORF g.26981 m.26981 type:complete len:66 (-) comp9311_c0_seq1:219-416(-)
MENFNRKEVTEYLKKEYEKWQKNEQLKSDEYSKFGCKKEPIVNDGPGFDIHKVASSKTATTAKDE